MESLLQRCWGENLFVVKPPRLLKVLGLLLLMVSFLANSFSQPAQVNPPTGGFAIDGNLKANTAVGDWLQGTGTGGYVLNNNGTPVNSGTTGHAIDLYNSTSDDVFANGSKFNDYISSLSWTNSGATGKDDINNGLYHVSSDANGHQWIMIGGDRAATVGTSFIDFELLQGHVTQNANFKFTGDGTAGTSGRTANDIDISMSYTNGGTKPTVTIYRWKLSGTTWAWDSTGSYLETNAFAQTNQNGTVDNSYGAFGSTTYQQFAFVEGAIDVTQLLSSAGNCQGIVIHTIWIKTKASATSTAALKDFMPPITVNLSFGNATISSVSPLCKNASPVCLTGSPSGGTFSGNGVSAVSTATCSSGYKFDPAAAGVVSGINTITYTVSLGLGCIKTVTQDITVLPLPTASISGTTAVCQGATAPNITFTGTGGTAPYTFTYKINNGSNLTVTSGSGTNPVSATVGVPTGTAGTYTYSLVSVQDASTGSCSQNQTGSATVTVNPLPTASISGTTAVCKNASSPNITFTGDGGTAPYTFTYKINNGSNLTVTSASGANPVSVTVAVPTSSTGSFVYSLVSVQDASTTSCAQNQTGSATVTVNPLPTASISGTTAVCKNASSPNITFTGNGGTAPYTFTYKINNGSNLTVTSASGTNPVSVTVAATTGTVGTYTYSLVSVQDASATSCSQNQSGTATITVNDIPSAPNATVTQPTCATATGTVTVTSPDNTLTYTLTGPSPSTATQSNSTGSFPGLASGSYGLTASKNGCTSSSATEVVNPQPPSPTFTVCITQPTLCTKGSLIITASNGTNFQYTINGGTNWVSTNTFSNLNPGDVTSVQVQNGAGCFSSPVACASLSSVCSISKSIVSTEQVTDIQAPTVKAYPNPFTDKINFVITTPVSGKGSLDVYNMMGQKVRTVYQGFIPAGTQTFQMSSEKQQVANLIYVLRIGEKKLSGKILQINQ
jgi:uncharacterized phosphosugar-binding protein